MRLFCVGLLTYLLLRSFRAVLLDVSGEHREQTCHGRRLAHERSDSIKRGMKAVNHNSSLSWVLWQGRTSTHLVRDLIVNS
jgi:hypothetical protein